MNRNTYDGKIAGLYDLEDTLGRGHFAVVKLARHVFTGEKVAVKVIDKTKLDEVSRSHLFQEVRCMKLVQHPNVVRLYEVIDTQTKLYLILEWGDGGDMYEYIMKHDKGLNEEAAKKYFRQIVHAISYCHKLHVVHRDLKPENVVFFEKLGMVKLTDFGFSNRFYPGQKLETSCGSLAYSAPEILLGDSYDAPAVDVWSLGVILFMLVCGQAPFQEANDSETLTMIMDCKYTIPSYVSPQCASLIQKMLIRDPERRSTIEEITNDPWLHSASNVQYADHLPLVSREHLSEEDHNYIIQKMVNGNIATQEEILEAVDQNAYSHITATYYLLAERKLRALRHERAKLLNATHVSDLSALAISPRNPSIPGCPPPENSLPRTVDSLLFPQESRRATQAVPSPVDALDECSSWVSRNKDGLSTSLSAGPGNVDILLKSKKPTVRLLTHNVNDAAVATPSTADGSDSSVKVNGGDAGAKDAGSKSCADVFSFAKNRFKAGNGPNNRKLHSVRSSPQLTLNEIYEEVESDGEPTSATNFLQSGGSNSTISSPSTRVLKTHQSVASPTILRKYEQRRRFKARTASCSSSDASDEDTETRKRKAEELKRIPDWRDRKNRDDDDSDQERGGPGLGGGNPGNNTSGGQTAEGRDQGSGANDSSNDKNNKWSKEGHQSYSSSPKRQAPFAVEVVRAGSEELLTQTARNKKAVLLQSQHIGKSADELCHSRMGKGNKTPSPILAHLRSQGSVSRNLVKTSVASPPPSPLSTPNITSLRQSKTLNQLNRFISPPNSMLGSPVLDIGDKENHALSRHCAVPGPLQLLNFKRPGKWRPPSYPQVSSTSASSLASANSHLPNSSLSANNNLVVANASVEPVKTSSRYRLGLYRLLRHAPNLGNSSNESSGGSVNDSSNGGVTKRWDINRNGFAGHSSAVANNRASNYGVAPYRVNTTPTSSPSHSKCCSLC